MEQARRLVLIRHAKAAEGNVDRERPLATRGMREAPEIGRWLAERQLVPDRIVVSPARRARQTWERAATAFDGGPDPVQDERIYDNSREALLAVVRDTPDSVRTLALVGHNPGMQEFAISFDDGTGDEAAREDVTGKYPTGGLAVFTVDGPWSGVTAGTLTAFAAPRP
ncbi:MAG TPA: histidine phosphatase family protein [Mycobacteriales bacterium]|jgi:phosphohistidine phosphatase